MNLDMLLLHIYLRVLSTLMVFISYVGILNGPMFSFVNMSDNFTRCVNGMQRLFEIADRLIELETTCACGAKAVISAKFLDGDIVLAGDQIDIGGDEKYRAICYSCWEKFKLAKEISLEEF